APTRQRRRRYPDDRQGRLYRARSAAGRRCRAFGAGASGRAGCARCRRDRRTTIDLRDLSLGLIALSGRFRSWWWFLFRLRRREHVIDVIDQAAHALGIGAEIMPPVA